MNEYTFKNGELDGMIPRGMYDPMIGVNMIVPQIIAKLLIRNANVSPPVITSLPEGLRTVPTDLKSAKKWLDALVAAGMDFHLEDNPSDIVCGDKGGVMLFDAAVIPHIRACQKALYAQTWPKKYDCPIGYMMKQIDKRDGTKELR